MLRTMLRRLSNAKLHKKDRSRSKPRSLVLLLLLTLGCTQAICQGMTKFKADTISLFRFEYIEKLTNNGSDCICSITNASLANLATVVVTGAPDDLKIDSAVFFNGVHTLSTGRQLVIADDFMGKRLTVMNLSATNNRIVVMIYCPDD